MNMDRTTLLLCLFLVSLLLIIFYMPSPRQQPQPATSMKTDSGVENQIRFHETLKKFVKSMGDIEKRLQTLEDNVGNIQRKQESSHVNEQKQQHVQVEQDTNHAAKHKHETNLENFVGEIKRNNYCLDSAEHNVDETVEVYECHSQGRNQEFQIEENTIRHKGWCLAVEKAGEGQLVVLKYCNDKNYILEWQYHDRTFKAGDSNFCMINKTNSGAVTLTRCNAEDTSQQWDMVQSEPR